MNASDAFGVVVRTIGLFMVMGALGQIGWALLNVARGGHGHAAGLLVSGIPALLIGFWFLRGARSIVSYAYSRET